jgi:3-dehydroquinate synthetase
LYGNLPDTAELTEVLLGWMRFDKKNSNNQINFSLLDAIGNCRIDQVATEEEIRKALGPTTHNP